MPDKQSSLFASGTGEVESMDIDEDRNVARPRATQPTDMRKPKPAPLANMVQAPHVSPSRIPRQLRTEIDKQLDQKVLQIKHNISQKIKNIHVDLIRQMVQQEGQMEDYLQEVARKNKEQKDIIKQLKAENE